MLLGRRRDCDLRLIVGIAIAAVMLVAALATTMRPSFRPDCDLPIYDGRSFQSMEDFEVLVQAQGNVPSILSNLMADWPALREWNGTDPSGASDPFVARYGDTLQLPIRDVDRVSSQGGYSDGEIGGGSGGTWTDGEDGDSRRRAGVSTLREYATSEGGAHGGGRLVFDARHDSLKSTFLDWTLCFSRLWTGFSFPPIALHFHDRCQSRTASYRCWRAISASPACSPRA